MFFFRVGNHHEQYLTKKKKKGEEEKKICCGLILNFPFELHALGMCVCVFVCIKPFSCVDKSECVMLMLLFGLSFWLLFFLSGAVSLSSEAADGLYMDMPNFFCIRIKCKDACLFVVAVSFALYTRFKTIMRNMTLLLPMVVFFFWAKSLHALNMSLCVTSFPVYLLNPKMRTHVIIPKALQRQTLFFPSLNQRYCGSFVVCSLFFWLRNCDTHEYRFCSVN